MNLLIICQWAVTSHGMVAKIVEEAEQTSAGDLQVSATSVAEVKDVDFSKYDVVLLAPQVRNYMKEVGSKCEPLGVPFASIDVVAYGLGEAGKILKQAQKLYAEKG